MKQCPSCSTTYTDDSLVFCLSDGARLRETEEQPTVVRSSGKGNLRVDIQDRSDPTIVSTIEPVAKSPAGIWLKAAAIIGVLAVMAVAIIGVGGALVYYKMGPAAPIPTPAQTPTAAPTTDREKERLQNEIANIRKRLDERDKNSNNWVSEPDKERGSPITATVASPKDGFLALRSEPNAEHGERIAKIPDGEEIEVLRCSGSQVTIAGRSGRWCYVSYNGQHGWVFDAWLEY